MGVNGVHSDWGVARSRETAQSLGIFPLNVALFSNFIGQTCPILTSKYGHLREQSSLILVTRILSHRIAPLQLILPMHIFKHCYRLLMTKAPLRTTTFQLTLILDIVEV